LIVTGTVTGVLAAGLLAVGGVALGWTALGTGALLMIGAAALLVAGTRTPRNRSGAATGLAPATA
jgi:hypothetical protein